MPPLNRRQFNSTCAKAAYSWSRPRAALGLQEKCGAKNQPGGPRTRMVKHESGGPLGAPGAQPATLGRCQGVRLVRRVVLLTRASPFGCEYRRVDSSARLSLEGRERRGADSTERRPLRDW